MTDVIEWTPEGRAALANEYTWGEQSLRDADREAIRTKLAASHTRFARCWELGLAAKDNQGNPRADDVGRAAVANANTVIRRALAGDASSTTSIEAAGALSLLGARSDSHDAALSELLVRDCGFAFMIDVLVAMWSMATSYHDPDWPKSEEHLAIWLFGISDDGDPSWVNDSSVSHGKGNLASYLAARTRVVESDASALESERRELRAAIDAAWTKAPLFARPALAVAADHRELAERAMREIFDANPSWYPHYARNNLVHLIGDRGLLDRLGLVKEARPRFRWLERIGIAALPIYEAMYTSKLTKHQREHLTKQLVNIRGPVVARLLAPYAEKAPFSADIRAYFTRAPELLALVRGDDKLAAYRAQLDKLAAKIAPKPEKPAAKKKKA